MKNKSLILAGIIALILTGLASVLADPDDFFGCSMGGMMYGAYGPGMAIFGWISWILVIALIIAGIYWLIKSADSKNK